MPYDKICTPNVSVVGVNGNIIAVAAPTVRSYDVTRVGARVRSVEPCKVYGLGCIRSCYFVCVRFGVQVSERTCRTIRFVLLMYPL